MVEKISKYIKALEKDAIPQLSVNCVILGFNDKQLQVVVNKITFDKTTLTVLPGGYVDQNENLSDAVQRIVRESTGLENILFKQFAVFGEASRSFGKSLGPLGKLIKGQDKKVIEWFSKRFISICYLALVDYQKIQLSPTEFLESAQWLPISKTKTLAMDHTEIVKSARASLVKELPYLPIASNLLPSKFTLPELHALVEAILGRAVDRPNFRRKILKTNMIVKVGTDTSGKRRPADVYSFKYGKNTSLTDDLSLGF